MPAISSRGRSPPGAAMTALEASTARAAAWAASRARSRSAGERRAEWARRRGPREIRRRGRPVTESSCSLATTNARPKRSRWRAMWLARASRSMPRSGVRTRWGGIVVVRAEGHGCGGEPAGGAPRDLDEHHPLATGHRAEVAVDVADGEGQKAGGAGETGAEFDALDIVLDRVGRAGDGERPVACRGEGVEGGERGHGAAATHPDQVVAVARPHQSEHAGKIRRFRPAARESEPGAGGAGDAGAHLAGVRRHQVGKFHRLASRGAGKTVGEAEDAPEAGSGCFQQAGQHVIANGGRPPALEDEEAAHTRPSASRQSSSSASSGVKSRVARQAGRANVRPRLSIAARIK